MALSRRRAGAVDTKVDPDQGVYVEIEGIMEVRTSSENCDVEDFHEDMFDFQKRVREIPDSFCRKDKDTTEQRFFFCLVCDCDLKNLRPLRDHVTGHKHIRKVVERKLEVLALGLPKEPQNAPRKKELKKERPRDDLGKSLKAGAAGLGTFPSKQPSGHWSQGLVQDMKDPAKVVHSTAVVVTIKDKFPKARLHYLVLPRQKVENLQCLQRGDLPLLLAMKQEAERLQAEHQDYEFQVGFHANPSMSRLHLHVLSTDLDSPCLKHQKHWNNFTKPQMFLQLAAVTSQLWRDGSVHPPDAVECKNALSAPLQCHKCDYTPRNMPDLKIHIKTHIHTSS